MKALILAAGYATRLYPLTENKPKALLVVKGRPIINYIVEKLNKVDEIDEIFVVTNKKFYDSFIKWNKTIKTSKPLSIINDGTEKNGKRLGSVGDINFVVEEKNITDDLLVIGSDNFFSFTVEKITNFFKKKNSTVVAVYDTKNKSRIAKKLGCVEADNDCKVIGFEEKPEHPKSTLASTCCYIFPKQDLHLIKEAIHENNFDRTGDLIKFILSKKSVYAFAFEGYWYDIGCFDEYDMVNKEDVKL